MESLPLCDALGEIIIVDLPSRSKEDLGVGESYATGASSWSRMTVTASRIAFVCALHFGSQDLTHKLTIYLFNYVHRPWLIAPHLGGEKTDTVAIKGSPDVSSKPFRWEKLGEAWFGWISGGWMTLPDTCRIFPYSVIRAVRNVGRFCLPKDGRSAIRIAETPSRRLLS